MPYRPYFSILSDRNTEIKSRWVVLDLTDVFLARLGLKAVTLARPGVALGLGLGHGLYE
jgi:hypothetical protein